MKEIYAGTYSTTPGPMINGICNWIQTKLYVHPCMDGISDNLWIKLCRMTCETHPMYGKDGSAVYADLENYVIVRKLGDKLITIATIREVA